MFQMEGRKIEITRLANWASLKTGDVPQAKVRLSLRASKLTSEELEVIPYGSAVAEVQSNQNDSDGDGGKDKPEITIDSAIPVMNYAFHDNGTQIGAITGGEISGSPSIRVVKGDATLRFTLSGVLDQGDLNHLNQHVLTEAGVELTTHETQQKLDV